MTTALIEWASIHEDPKRRPKSQSSIPDANTITVDATSTGATTNRNRTGGAPARRNAALPA